MIQDYQEIDLKDMLDTVIRGQKEILQNQWEMINRIEKLEASIIPQTRVHLPLEELPEPCKTKDEILTLANRLEMEKNFRDSLYNSFRKIGGGSPKRMTSLIMSHIGNTETLGQFTRYGNTKQLFPGQTKSAVWGYKRKYPKETEKKDSVAG